MTAEQSLYARIALSVAASVAGVLLATSHRIHEPSSPRFRLIIFTALPFSRALLYLFVFFVIRQPPRGDVIAFYFPEAKSILSGLIPYRDFLSSYGPLNGYCNAAILRVWFSPLALIMFAIIVESFLLPMWFSIGHRLFEERELRIASVLYLASPLSLQFVTIDGTNSICIALLVALAMFLLIQERPLFSGGALAFSILTVKVLPLLYLPVYFVASSKRFRLLLGFVTTIVLGYAFFVLKGAPVLQPLTREGSMKTAGNLPYLVEAIVGFEVPARIWDLLVLVAVIAVWFFFAVKARHKSGPLTFRALYATMPALTFALLLFSKKSYPTYLMFVLFPVCLLVGVTGRRTLLSFAVLQTAVIAAPSVWFTLTGCVSATLLHSEMVSGRPLAICFVALQIAVVATYAWLLWISLLWIPGSNTPTHLKWV